MADVRAGRVLGPPRTERLRGGDQANEPGRLAVPLSAPFGYKLQRIEGNLPQLHLMTSNGRLIPPIAAIQKPPHVLATDRKLIDTPLAPLPSEPAFLGVGRWQ
jgi:hypothetical protein